VLSSRQIDFDELDFRTQILLMRSGLGNPGISKIFMLAP
jgi:hypothetical protein